MAADTSTHSSSEDLSIDGWQLVPSPRQDITNSIVLHSDSSDDDIVIIEREYCRKPIFVESEDEEFPDLIEQSDPHHFAEQPDIPDIEQRDSPDFKEQSDCPEVFELHNSPDFIEQSDWPEVFEQRNSPDFIEQSDWSEVFELRNFPDFIEQSDWPDHIEHSDFPYFIRQPNLPKSSVYLRNEELLSSSADDVLGSHTENPMDSFIETLNNPTEDSNRRLLREQPHSFIENSVFCLCLLFLFSTCYFSMVRMYSDLTSKLDFNSSVLENSSPVFKPNVDLAEYVNLEKSDRVSPEFDLKDDIDAKLRDKKLQMDGVFAKYFTISKYTYVFNDNIYELNVTELLRDESLNNDVLSDKFISHFMQLKDFRNIKCDDYDKIIKAKLPLTCRTESHVAIFFEKKYYQNIFENVFNVLQIENNKLTDLDLNIVNILNGILPNRVSKLERSIDLDAIKVQKQKIQVETYQQKPTVINSEVKDQIRTNTKNKQTIEELFDNTLPNVEKILGGNLDIKIHENIHEAEAHLKTLIENMKNALKQFEMHCILLQIANDMKCKNGQCFRKNKISEIENLEDMLWHLKNNRSSTYDEKISTDNVSGFVYDTAPVTNRWSSKMKTNKSKNSEYYDNLNGEWILKLGKSRENYRRQFKKKDEKKRHNKFKEEKDKFDYSYRVWVKQAKQKLNKNYLKLSSHVKSKFKNISESVKRNYEKLMSSDWKHYAKSIFQRFRL